MRQNLVLYLWRLNQGWVVTMGGATVAPTKESSNESIQHEGDFRGFLWLATCNPLLILSTWSDSKQGVLHSSIGAFEGNRTPEEASDEDEPDLDVAPRQCTTSLVVPCAQFSGEKRKDRCKPATLFSRFSSSGLFFWFLSWSPPWKVPVSTHLTRSRKIRRRSCSPFWKRRSRKRSKVSRNVGSGVLLKKETTLKATNLNR